MRAEGAVASHLDPLLAAPFASLGSILTDHSQDTRSRSDIRACGIGHGDLRITAAMKSVENMKRLRLLLLQLSLARVEEVNGGAKYRWGHSEGQPIMFASISPHVSAPM